MGANIFQHAHSRSGAIGNSSGDNSHAGDSLFPWAGLVACPAEGEWVSTYKCSKRVLAVIDPADLRVCRESCLHGRALAMSAGVRCQLPDFVPVTLPSESLIPMRPQGMRSSELMRRLMAEASGGPGAKKAEEPREAARKPAPRAIPSAPAMDAGRPAAADPGRVTAVMALPATVNEELHERIGENATAVAAAPPSMLDLDALKRALSAFPGRMRRSRLIVVRGAYNRLAQAGRRYKCFKGFMADLVAAGLHVDPSRDRLQDSWVRLDEAAKGINDKQRAA